MRKSRLIRMLLLISAASMIGCGGGGGGGIDDQGLPTISNLTIEPNPLNELSTIVTFEVTNADSARVIYQADNEVQQATPFYPVQPGSNYIATLGLSPLKLYGHIVEAIGPGGSSQSEELELASGELPPILSDVGLNATGTADLGYLLTALFLENSTACVVAFDSENILTWYRCFEEGVPPTETKQQPNGNFTVFLGSTQGWQPTAGRFVEFLPSGETIQSYQADPPLFTDNHELLFSMNGIDIESVHLFGYELRTTDLSRFGGQPDALLAGHLLLRQSPAGDTEFIWSAWDNLSIDDWIEPPDAFKLLPNIDFDHPNSLDFDLDGNYIVSFRNLGEITKIDATTGAIHWRFGGLNNQFVILNDPLGGFSGQHSARVLDNGNLLLYDNGPRHVPPESRAVEYELDISTMTATMVWEFRHNPPIHTPFVGAVQRLANGDTLVSFGQAGHVDLVDSDGAVLWEGDLVVNNSPISFYRAVRIQSIYEFERP